ncbi:hypothetical protein QBC46DRAFT_139767 [Diplogelasinospora grovesii]|uniref:WSC domain-containing protein n=1 Tax=Diplogelasinospora grovesii TaxID=303347 RepID=A0AAN6N9T5_9PEZI|nr:hypothetical protein QBC46DRAFT_139767 [Diplogelasinospora grovesii]
MATQRNARFWAYIALSTLQICIVIAAQGPSVPMAYCASINTADMSAIQSDYQSDGRCYGNCTDANYALAIVQAKNCWCSNFIPAVGDRKSLDKCEDPCPGYPSDYCGGAGLFGYMQLKNSPSGIAGAGSSAATSTDSPSSTSSTVQNTVTLTPSISPSSASTSSSSLGSTTTSPSDDSTTPTPTPSVQTVTVGGVVKTVTATPTATGTSSAELTSSSRSGGLPTGAAVGIAVGVIGAIAVAGVFLWMWWARRKRRDAEADGRFSSSSLRGSSSGGMMSTPRTNEMSDPRSAMGAGGQGMAEAWDASQSAKRRSHLMPVDPRLEFKGLYQNKSRESVNSLQDNQDYSRRILRPTNPDPTDD